MRRDIKIGHQTEKQLLVFQRVHLPNLQNQNLNCTILTLKRKWAGKLLEEQLIIQSKDGKRLKNILMVCF